jgi:Lipocalin-like domain
MKTRRTVTLSTIAVLGLAFVMSIPASTAAESIREKAVGMWKLISWEAVRSNGQALNIIMGPHPIGLIIYQPNGYMAVQGMHDPRPMFAESGLTATRDELRNAYFGYYAYWGTYTINEADSTVEHNIQSSLRPEEVGVKYKRSLSFDGTKLVLTTPAYKAILAFCRNLPAFCRDLPEDAQLREGEELVNRLTWERIE